MTSTIDRVHVACTALGNRLVIGLRTKTPGIMETKRDAEPEILTAVVQHLDKLPAKGKIITFDGETWWDISVKQVPNPRLPIVTVTEPRAAE